MPTGDDPEIEDLPEAQTGGSRTGGPETASRPPIHESETVIRSPHSDSESAAQTAGTGSAGSAVADRLTSRILSSRLG